MKLRREARYPNQLQAMIDACGKRQADLWQEVDCSNISEFCCGHIRPQLRTAEQICAVLTRWAGKPVPVDSIFPQLANKKRGPAARPPRNDAAIAAILSGADGITVMEDDQ